MFARIERLNIPHEAGSVSSSFWLILAAEEKIIRLGERLLARTVLAHEQISGEGRIPCRVARLAFFVSPRVCRKHGWNGSSPCSRSQKASQRFRGCSGPGRSVQGSQAHGE